MWIQVRHLEEHFPDPIIIIVRTCVIVWMGAVGEKCFASAGQGLCESLGSLLLPATRCVQHSGKRVHVTKIIIVMVFFVFFFYETFLLFCVDECISNEFKEQMRQTWLVEGLR